MQKFLRISSVMLFIFSFSFLSLAQTEEEMKAWQEYMTPGKMHEWMAKSVGDWTFESKMWMMPDTDPQVSTGTMTSEMILGGRYMKQTHKGEMMGMPFEGINIFAYDNAKQMFVSSWIDNMGTGIMTCEGKYDEANKTINMAGSYFDPETKADKKFREVIKILGDKQQMFEMYIMAGDKEMKNMEIMMTKK